MSTKELLSPLVGTSFRKLGKAILAILPAGQSLILDPEPDNLYDSDAIKVSVDLRTVNIPLDPVDPILDEMQSLLELEEDPIVQLGYIPTSGGRFDTLRCGTKEVKAAMQSGPDWNATLTFSPDGRAIVHVEYWQEDPT